MTPDCGNRECLDVGCWRGRAERAEKRSTRLRKGLMAIANLTAQPAAFACGVLDRDDDERGVPLPPAPETTGKEEE